MNARMYHHEIWIDETNTDALRYFFNEYLKESGFETLDFIEHRFKPYGYTAVWVISESHLFLHTFPEERKSYVQIASCSFEKYINFMRRIEDIHDNFKED